MNVLVGEHEATDKRQRRREGIREERNTEGGILYVYLPAGELWFASSPQALLLLGSHELPHHDVGQEEREGRSHQPSRRDSNILLSINRNCHNHVGEINPHESSEL